MKSNKKNIIVLILLVMGFLILPSIKLDFGEGQKTTVINPKQSAGYSESFIHVDGNWSDTRDAYDWCDGDGSWGNPYTIENVTVDSGGTGSGILIENSDTEYFIIRNCTVYNAGSGTYDAGIKLENTNKGILTNNNCSNNPQHGILLVNSCDNNTLSGNTVNKNSLGICLEFSNNSTISGNTACNNTDFGIYLYQSNHNTISGNTACNTTYTGIYLIYSNYNNITGNTANDNTQDGIYLTQCDNNTISENTACNNTGDGIFLETNCNNNTISGNTANDNYDGIYLGNCDNNTISGNTANDNDKNGIYLTQCDNNTISGNLANGNGYDGIHLKAQCGNNVISGNTLNDNDDSGLYFLADNDGNTISGNIASNNPVSGITIEENTNNNNTIYRNFFLINGKHAVDNGPDNKWNSTAIGNYWDNHTDPDDNSDGIVDIQYNISGSAESIDYLPIAEDGTPSITINSPTSSDVFGVTAPSFDLNITDDYLDEMWYTIDGGINNYTFIENGIINQTAWAAKTEGDVTITFYASDIPRNIGIAEVSVVKDTTDPIIVINSPVDDDEFGTQAPLFNITVTENNLDAIWYSFDGGVSTYAITNNTFFNQTAWTALTEGDVTITFYARDLAGNEASESVTVIKSVPSGLDPGVIITIVVISIVGGVAVITVVYVFMKKRATPE